jgi:hypothetical protein
VLTDAAVWELARLVSASPAAHNLRSLDLSGSTALTWRACRPLAQLIGGRRAAGSLQQQAGDEAPAGGELAGTAAPLAAAGARLRFLRLAGVAICDKGAAVLAEALDGNKHLEVGWPGGAVTGGCRLHDKASQLPFGPPPPPTMAGVALC